ncbi:hypothetical protein Taro_031056 [Colocasia esculenta]|uniref:Potassium transporter n=1 Tax=Colocasia esculenta TaxID=4460 RepID=A0A843VP14_COLES|nr:hypothetical protein [Colocasia esculenta]
MDLEGGQYRDPVKRQSWRTVLTLAYQSLGVVYGDLSTSPLYVYKSTFAEDIEHSETNEEIYGVLSFVFWTLTLVPLLKYVFIVLRADDNGEGGTFALYSLLCRHARVGFLPNGQVADEELSAYKRDGCACGAPAAGTGSRIKKMLEKYKVLQRLLLILALIGTCMVIGDGVLTPAISGCFQPFRVSNFPCPGSIINVRISFRQQVSFRQFSGPVLYLLAVVERTFLNSEVKFTMLRHLDFEDRYKRWRRLHVEVPVACIILVCLFALQHYGTHRVGFLFAPIVVTWLLCISAIGVYNIIYWNPHVYQAFSPYYMYKFLKKTQRSGWMSLGGILLCITGSEAMFADLGHFSQLSIKEAITISQLFDTSFHQWPAPLGSSGDLVGKRNSPSGPLQGSLFGSQFVLIAFTSVVYPSLLLAYMGQAAYLSKHHIIESDYRIGFYVSVPERLRWPVLAIAILAAVVGSQAIITGTFSIIKQCSALGCFPRVKIVHTSSKVHGQIYIPEINWILMILCLAVTIGFRDTKRMGNASGLAVITVMLVTTCLMSLVIVLCWNQSIFLAMGFILFFGTIEALYFSASLIKFLQGAWVPIALSFIFMLVMYIWHYGTLKKYEFDVQNKVSINWLLSLGPSLGIVRVRGIGLIHTELVSGIPAIFSHFVTNLPAFHQVLVFMCIKSVQVPHVQPEERFLVGRIGPKEYRLYRCIVRYGYHDVHKDDLEFEKDLVCSIAEFIRSERPEPNGTVEEPEKDNEKMAVVGTGVRLYEEDVKPEDAAGPSELKEIQSPIVTPRKRVRFVLPNSPKIDARMTEELQELMEAREAGMAFILGHSYVRAKKGSSFLKRLVIDVGYDFLRRNSRGPSYAMNVPHASTLEVGMIYHV